MGNIEKQDLTKKIIDILDRHDNGTEVNRQIAEMVFDSPDTPEKDALIALIYHDGIGVDPDLEKSFEFAEKAAFQGNQGLGYYLLGYMCENAETPDQAEGGTRQKYDHYDAERFYEICSKIESPWREPAVIWLGDYYMDSAKGGDPEIGVEYYESIAGSNADAAGRLSDHYWDLAMPDYLDDEEWTANLFKWTEVAADLDPEEFTYRLGWLYADGIGCEKDSDKAMQLFKKAYELGDWRGAKTTADIMRNSLRANADIDE
ncbi:MAG: hypothetical protein K2G13_09945, partial [Muribaculaceae bacterium]|nr:hypothetical protein [Muribaculaceae bacterium]